MKKLLKWLAYSALGISPLVLAGECDWLPLGTGVGPAAYSCAVLEGGEVVYGGSITLAGQTLVQQIAQWDGQSWNPIGSGLNNFVRTILAIPGGGFIAGGHFTQAGGVQTGLIAKWDGSNWSALGLGLDAGSCRAIIQTSNGDLIAAGSFLQADNQPAWGVARWNGKSWTKLGNTTVGGGVAGHFGAQSSVTMILDVDEMPNGDIVVCGNFLTADGISAPGIAIWDGAGWSPLGSGTDWVVRSITVLPSGELLVAGLFGSAGGVASRGLAIWDGTNWRAAGDGLNGINASSPFKLVNTPQGKVMMCGAFDMVDSVHANSVAIFDPDTESWSPLGSGMLPSIQTVVYDIDVDASGAIYAAGQFASAAGHTDAWNAAVFECALVCTADFTGDGELNFFDVSEFLAAFSVNDPIADLTGEGQWNFFDVSLFLNAFGTGCP